LFFKKRVQGDDDRIWIANDQKWNGIADDVLRERGENIFILVVAHFKKTAAVRRGKICNFLHDPPREPE
jgi:hypothetical protein